MTSNEKLKLIREELKLSQSNFAKAIGLTQSKIADIEVGKGRVTPAIAKKAEEVFKANIRWIFFNEGEMFLTETTKLDTTDIPEKGDVECSAGAGCFVDNESITGYMTFETRFLKQIGANIPSCDILKVKGDSMYPTLKTGDSVLVDTSKKDVVDGRIYILRIEDTLYVKRLQKLTKGKLKVISDNKEFNSIELIPIEDDFEVCGRVLWSGRTYE